MDIIVNVAKSIAIDNCGYISRLNINVINAGNPNEEMTGYLWLKDLEIVYLISSNGSFKEWTINEANN